MTGLAKQTQTCEKHVCSRYIANYLRGINVVLQKMRIAYAEYIFVLQKARYRWKRTLPMCFMSHGEATRASDVQR